MMDFDYVCQRSEPSAACMLYPMVGGDSKQNFYWGHKEILVPGNMQSCFTPDETSPLFAFTAVEKQGP